MLEIFSPSSSSGAASPMNWCWATLSGPDAQDFLHRVTSADVRGLKDGEGTPGCFLTAQGKFRAYFTLWNYGPGEYGLEFEAGSQSTWKTALFLAIDQYTFSEKMTLTDVTGLESLWIFGDMPDATPRKTRTIDEELRICHHGDRDFGMPWITVWGRPERLMQWRDRTLGDARLLGTEEVERRRILALRPRVEHEILDSSLPLEVGLTDAVASNKGCYPGQEVIEKIISLGSPARRLVLLDVPKNSASSTAVGAKLMTTGENPMEIGELTSICQEGAGSKALGFVRKIHAKENFPIFVSSAGSAAQPATILRVAPYV